MIPNFAQNGNLPSGVHSAIWQEVVERFGFNAHRQYLLTGLKNALQSLKNAGCKVVYLNGSFVTAKEIPNDFDCCWEPDGVDPLLLDPVLLIFNNRRAAQKAKYYGELFISTNQGRAGKTFLEFFQQDKNTGEPKGIVAINLQSEQL